MCIWLITAAAVCRLCCAARLEVVADAERLTAAVLEVLPVCSPAIQQQLVGFLPEVVLPQDHEVGEEGGTHRQQQHR
jgi:hypothetical protein